MADRHSKHSFSLPDSLVGRIEDLMVSQRKFNRSGMVSDLLEDAVKRAEESEDAARVKEGEEDI